MREGSKAVSIWNGTTDGEWYRSCAYELIIETAEHFASFTEKVKIGTNFSGQIIKLNTDIMLNDTTNWQDWVNKEPVNKWTPIGTSDNPFKGTFDGNGYAVSGVYINNSDGDHQGLFGVANEKATINNLGVIYSYVKGKNNVGGLVGNNAGEISNCYSICMVTGQENVGGLVGWNSSKISNCYSVGRVTGTGTGIGVLIGTNKNGEINKSYYSKGTSGQNDIGEGKTTEEMKQQNTFVNWDFEKIWKLSNKVNDGYPHLRNEQ